uniref:Uncharacterized protein n=1 Tax=Glossina pallidipes TaxID=7398 RepID=A0A1A9ZVQ0_GLOPL
MNASKRGATHIFNHITAQDDKIPRFIEFLALGEENAIKNKQMAIVGSNNDGLQADAKALHSNLQILCITQTALVLLIRLFGIAVNAVAFVVFTINAKAKGICVWHEHYQHMFAASYLLHKFHCNVAVANDDYANDVMAQNKSSSHTINSVIAIVKIDRVIEVSRSNCKSPLYKP